MVLVFFSVGVIILVRGRVLVDVIGRVGILDVFMVTKIVLVGKGHHCYGLG
jgi:hypothetical protein